MTKPPRAEKRNAWSPLLIWRNRTGQWYWALKSRNGNCIADGSEGYYTRAKAAAGFRATAKLAAKALAQMEGGK